MLVKRLGWRQHLCFCHSHQMLSLTPLPIRPHLAGSVNQRGLIHPTAQALPQTTDLNAEAATVDISAKTLELNYI